MRKLEITREVSLSELKKRHRKESNYRVRDRILMISNVQEGKSATQVAEMLKCSPTTVTKWVHRFNALGFEGLNDEFRSGRPPVVDYKILESALEKSPKAFNYDYEYWFPKLVYNYILDHMKIEIVFEYVYELIYRLEYTLITPKTRSYKSDPEKVKLFKKKLKKR